MRIRLCILFIAYYKSNSVLEKKIVTRRNILFKKQFHCFKTKILFQIQFFCFRNKILVMKDFVSDTKKKYFKNKLFCFLE